MMASRMMLGTFGLCAFLIGSNSMVGHEYVAGVAGCVIAIIIFMSLTT